jgi:hypothetical protein
MTSHSISRSYRGRAAADPLMQEARERQHRRRRLLTIAGLILVASVASYLLFGRGRPSDRGSSGSAAPARPTIARLEAAIAGHSDNFILANAYTSNGPALGHGWIDLKTGSGRWVLPGEVVLQTVKPQPHDPTQATVSTTFINYKTHTWYRTSRDESAKTAHPTIVNPLADRPEGARLRLLGVVNVDGRKAYHFRSAYVYPSTTSTTRMDIWVSAPQAYLIRYTATTKQGKVIKRVDNRWLPRTPANVELTTATIPSGFKQLSAPS